jgi:flagellar protein FliO/FliZ
MFDLFGAEMPLAVRFFLAFLIVLGLIGVAAWAVRRFGSARIGGAVRGRQPRLAVIDYATVDARRRLILVRRDNIEHLVMIGGPTDVVVEANIVRAAPAGRDVPAARPPTVPEPLPRAIPLPEAGNGNGNYSWPLQPEPIAPFPPSRRARGEPLSDESEVSEPSRPQHETPSVLVEDTATHSAPSVAPIAPMPARPAPAPRPAEIRAVETPRPAQTRAPAPAINAEAVSAADRSLAEMAHRLEAALRKPTAEAGPAKAEAPAPTADAESAPIITPRARATDARPAAAPGKAKETKLYDTLEQEMASLLGRPPGKAG